MFEKIARDCVLIAAMGFGLVYTIKNQDTLKAQFGLSGAEQTQELADSATNGAANAATNIAQNIAPAQSQISSGTVSITKSADGQFWAQSQVNGAYVKFLVDTGASTVALTLEDARKAGLSLNSLNFSHQVNTAGGTIPAAYVELKSVSVGTITLRNVKAVIIKDGLHTSLLGMSYLGQLQKVEATPQSLILRL